MRSVHRLRRSGSVTVTVLILLPVLLGFVVLAIFAAQVRDCRIEMQNCADASALAGAGELADDCWLRGDVEELRARLAQARLVASHYAGVNLVQGEPVRLLGDADNGPDIVFGHLDRPFGSDFKPAKLAQLDELTADDINAVRIVARRTRARDSELNLVRGPLLNRGATDLVSIATAMLERRVVGLRPISSQPVPCMPLALFSDPNGEHPRCFEVRARRGVGYDRHRRKHDEEQPQSGKKCFEEGADGIPEVTVVLGGDIRQDTVPASLVRLGALDLAAVVRQVREGVAAEDFAEFGGELTLGPDNLRIVRGSPHCPPAGAGGLQALAAACDSLRASGEPRVWPIFRYGAEDLVTISGFVAARVVQVRAAQGQDGDQLELVLQPCVMACAAAVVDPERAESIRNNYICKVRLAQ